MFAPGEKELRTRQREALETDRGPLAFVQSGLTDTAIENKLRRLLPEAEEAPPLLLPM